MSDINGTIREVAQEFAKDLQVLRAKMARQSSFQEDVLTLRVAVKHEEVQFELSYSQGYGSPVKASTLGALLDEVYRRAGFDDREAGRLQAQGEALRALPPPTGDEPTDDEPLEIHF